MKILHHIEPILKIAIPAIFKNLRFVAITKASYQGVANTILDLTVFDTECNRKEVITFGTKSLLLQEKLDVITPQSIRTIVKLILPMIVIRYGRNRVHLYLAEGISYPFVIFIAHDYCVLS